MNNRNSLSAQQRRNQLARQRGFASYAQQRRYERVISNEGQLQRLPERARTRRAEALDVINIARRRGIPVADAARELGVPLSAVTWWGAPALDHPRHRRPMALRSDRILRAQPLIVDGRLQMVTTRGSAAARRAAEAFKTQRAFIEGDPDAGDKLAALAGTRVGGHVVETDPAVLGEIGRRGELGDIAEMYRAWVA